MASEIKKYGTWIAGCTVICFLIGYCVASLTTVVPCENLTVNNMRRLERRLLTSVERGEPAILDVAQKLICGNENLCLDGWGRRFSIIPFWEKRVALVSHGDPAIEKLDSGIEHTIIRIIDFSRLSNLED